jgi:hypothetical protein
MEAGGPCEDGTDDGEEGFCVRSVHVERAVAQIDGDLVAIELPYASGIDGRLQLLLDGEQRVEAVARVVELSDDGVLVHLRLPPPNAKVQRTRPRTDGP